ANKAEFGDSYSMLDFVSPSAAAAARSRRDQMLAELAGRASMDCLETKPHWGALSPGCTICTQGQWSCLFINNICNGRCFYCPTSQISSSEPTTNSLRFPNPQDYIDYLSAFGFKGASISGGEPLLTFDRTIRYVRKIKKRFGSGLHLWLYTNGILASDDNIGQLAEAGLDEIRFDISADNYSLEHIGLARGRIPFVTVEIPAIPEDEERLRHLLPRLADAGVSHLNLHHMRCTPHNFKHLIGRPYAMLHGSKVTVLESELAALALLVAAADLGEGAPAVNYCSYAYKSGFQGRAARLRAATRLVKPFEDVTGAGYIRSLCLKGSDQELAVRAGTLASRTGESGRWRLEKGRGLLFGQEVWPLVDCTGLALQVSYATPRLQGAISYQGSHQEIVLNRKRTIVAERQTTLSRLVPEEEWRRLAAMFLAEPGSRSGEGEGALADLILFERLPAGLVPYS
ncbi:MAG: radical SAM protein, partial [Desulfobulbaceae bacterium]|nr:radical SAM protein [Desulfobulbaceae bacterium]